MVGGRLDEIGTMLAAMFEIVSESAVFGIAEGVEAFDSPVTRLVFHDPLKGGCAVSCQELDYVEGALWIEELRSTGRGDSVVNG